MSIKVNTKLRWAFYGSVAVGVSIIAAGLRLGGAAEVRSNGGEILFLSLVGLVWMVVGVCFFPWVGLNVRLDIIGQRNAAATVALCAAAVSMALLYTGGSLGEGPSFLDNYFSAGLATVDWFALWALLECFGRVSASIAVERDMASGLRFGGYALATALILARAVAGDWRSTAGTIHDFLRAGWPAALLALVAVGIEQLARPTRARPCPSWPTFGCLPILLYIAASFFWLVHLGPWEGMPR